MSSKPPLVSVCIPTYNRAGLLHECITSVLAQTFEDFELIVSDNASTDATTDVVNGFADSRIRYSRNSSNIGHLENFNRCLRLATGEFVVLFFDDDVMLPGNLAVKVDALRRHPRAGLVHSSYNIIDESGQVVVADTNKFRQLGIADGASDSVEPGRRALETLLRSNFINESTVMIRRACYERIGGFTDQLRLAFDWEYWLRISRFHDIAFVAVPLVNWRSHSTSLTDLQFRRINDEVSSGRESIAIARVETDLLSRARVEESYLQEVSAAARSEIRKHLRRQMADDVGGYAGALLGERGPSASVARFVLRMCRAYPGILSYSVVWKALLKTQLSRRRVLQLKHLARV